MERRSFLSSVGSSPLLSLIPNPVETDYKVFSDWFNSSGKLHFYDREKWTPENRDEVVDTFRFDTYPSYLSAVKYRSKLLRDVEFSKYDFTRFYLRGVTINEDSHQLRFQSKDSDSEFLVDENDDWDHYVVRFVYVEDSRVELDTIGDVHTHVQEVME